MGISLLNLPVLLECGVGAVKDPCKQITFVGKNIISFVFSPKRCKIKKIDKKKGCIGTCVECGRRAIGTDVGRVKLGGN